MIPLGFLCWNGVYRVDIDVISGFFAGVARVGRRCSVIKTLLRYLLGWWVDSKIRSNRYIESKDFGDSIFFEFFKLPSKHLEVQPKKAKQCKEVRKHANIQNCSKTMPYTWKKHLKTHRHHATTCMSHRLWICLHVLWVGACSGICFAFFWCGVLCLHFLPCVYLLAVVASTMLSLIIFWCPSQVM